MATAKKNAGRRGQTIVFVDESAFMLQPIVGRTWAKEGKTPILVMRARRDRWSVMAAITFRPNAKRRPLGMHFIAFDDNVNTNRAVLFVRALRQQLGTKLLIVWDNLRVHHAAQKALTRMKSVSFAYLPAYAPQLNPVEFLWAHSKGRCLLNCVPDTKSELGEHILATLRSTRQRSDVLRGCFHAAGLTL